MCTSIAELSLGLSLMTQEAKGLEGETLEADMFYYVFLCIQKVCSCSIILAYVMCLLVISFSDLLVLVLYAVYA